MRWVVWLVVLFAVAVVAAMTLGANDGLASFYWRGWRLDVSLNLFILVLVAGFVGAAGSVRFARWLWGMPERARAWREGRREQALQEAQREALIEFMAARYSRAVKAAQRAQNLLRDAGPRPGHAEALAVNHLLAALALHRLRDRPARQEQADAVAACLSAGTPGSVSEGAAAAARATSLLEGLHLLGAEWALDDRDAAACLNQLEQLAPGAARRIHAQRLRLQAHRMAAQPAEALKSARLLAKHQAFTPQAATSLLRTLAVDVLHTARDAEGLQRLWLELDREDRQDIGVTCQAAALAARYAGQAWARKILRPLFEAFSSLAAEQREEVAAALCAVVQGVEPEWLALVEPLESRHAREPVVAAAVAFVYAERQLWGKAQGLLEQTARGQAPVSIRREAWCRLAMLAQQREQEAQAQACFRAAALLR